MSDESNTTVEVVSVGKRGRQPTEYLTRAKFIAAVRGGEVLPGMERIAEVVEGARIMVHAGWKATVFEPTATGLNILRLVTIGKSQRPEVLETLPYTFEEVIQKLTAPTASDKAFAKAQKANKQVPTE